MPRFILKKIQDYGVTVICLNPTLLKMLIAEYNDSKYSIPTLKTMYASGSILDKTYYKAHRTLYFLNIYHVYSLSENAPMVIAKGRIV